MNVVTSNIQPVVFVTISKKKYLKTNLKILKCHFSFIVLTKY